MFKRPISEYFFQKSSSKTNRFTILNSDQFRAIFRRKTLLKLGIAINPNQYRHIAIGISRRFLNKGNQFQPDEETHSDPENDPDYEDDVIDLQAGHRTKTSGSIYARGVLERSGEVFSLKKRFRDSSIVSFRVLLFF